MTNHKVVPHEAFDGMYEAGGWSFSIDPDEDGDLTYVENAIEAWQAWREFLIHRQNEENQEKLF